MKMYVKPLVEVSVVQLESQLMAGSLTGTDTAGGNDVNIGNGGIAGDGSSADAKGQDSWHIWD